jgi:RNA polymerase sigma factor FliA
VPLSDDKGQLLEKYGPYVRSIASTVRRQFGSRLDLEDLVAYGNIGLYEAAERFDAKVGAAFITFAHYRIKGAIFDGLRRMGTLKGPEQRSAYLTERATAYLASGAASDSGRPTVLADDVREVEGAVASLAAIFAAGMDGLDHLQVRDESPGPEERLEQSELKQRVRAAIQTLPDNERRLLVAYYYESKTLEEAGAVIGQSKSWASRLHARAVDRLRDFLDEDAAERRRTAKPRGRSLVASISRGGPQVPAPRPGPAPARPGASGGKGGTR